LPGTFPSLERLALFRGLMLLRSGFRVTQRDQDALDGLPQPRKPVLDNFPDNVGINAEVAVGKAVAEIPKDALPVRNK